MKKLFLLITLFWMVQVNAQYSPTGVKSMFSNGIALGTQSYKYYPDSNVIYWRYDSVLMGKYKGTPFQIGKAGSVGSFINNQYGSNLSAQTAKFYISDTVRTSGMIVGGTALLTTGILKSVGGITSISDETGALGLQFNTVSGSLGQYGGSTGTFTWNGKIKTDSIYATTISRGSLYDYAGTKKASWGIGGYSLYLSNNKAEYESNFGSGFTARSLIDKGYADSAIALKVGIADTSSMLSNYRRKTTLIENSDLRNSSVTIGSTAISLGGTSTTLSGLSSVTSTGFTGALTGNASTATTLATARTINGTSFDGSANITVTAAAGTLTGATLASGVTASSLTSVGTLTSLASGTGTFTASANPAIFASTSASTGYTEYRYNTSTVAGYIGNGSGILSGASASDFIVRGESALVFATGNNNRYTISSSGNHDFKGGSITTTSTVTASAFYESSDKRLKKVLGRSYSRDGIDAIQFRWKDVKRGQGVKLGYIAQEVQKVLPYAVKEGQDKYLTVDYTMVHTYKIAQQEQRITELERELAELKDLIKKLK